MAKQIIIYSKWLIFLYSFAALVLSPWIIYLAFSLPAREEAARWDAAWVGFDIFMLALVIITAILAYRKSARLIPVASSLATVILIDAWFDVMTAAVGIQLLEALVFACLIEVPLAVTTFVLVHQALAHVHWKSEAPFIVGPNHGKQL
ncbi:MAG: hypothetical protein NVS1B7_7870 [Candidatus Saccharimonadales bacterium]